MDSPWMRTTSFTLHASAGRRAARDAAAAAGRRQVRDALARRCPRAAHPPADARLPAAARLRYAMRETRRQHTLIIKAPSILEVAWLTHSLGQGISPRALLPLAVAACANGHAQPRASRAQPARPRGRVPWPPRADLSRAARSPFPRCRHARALAARRAAPPRHARPRAGVLRALRRCCCSARRASALRRAGDVHAALLRHCRRASAATRTCCGALTRPRACAAACCCARMRLVGGFPPRRTDARGAAVIMLVCRFVGLIFKALGQPTVIGEIIAGASCSLARLLASSAQREALSAYITRAQASCLGRA